MRIAIVGAGISGLTCAHLLAREHDITVYEASSYSGGHTNTIRVEAERHTRSIDTGFIVCNDRNYPNFMRLLDKLGVITQPTHMSFSVKGEEEDFEYCGTPRGLFCQPGNLTKPSFWRMICDLLRFNHELKVILRRGETGESLEDFLQRQHFSPVFVQRLIVPQVCAVWSADPRDMSTFPVRFLAEFFSNHGMLGFTNRPQWSTVTGGSARYVEALTLPFRDRIKLDCPVQSVTRTPEHVTILAGGRSGGWVTESFDHVVIATHSDQALAMLSDPSERESEVLSAIPYQLNEAVLHTDSTLLPRRRAARAAWNYHLLKEPKPLSTVTYYMNHLQRIDSDLDYCVTLNRTEAIDPTKIIRKISYAHPVYTPRGIAAQSQHSAISALDTRTHYCGAYWGSGFHEDGVVSALRACSPFGVTL